MQVREQLVGLKSLRRRLTSVDNALAACSRNIAEGRVSDYVITDEMTLAKVRLARIGLWYSIGRVGLDEIEAEMRSIALFVIEHDLHYLRSPADDDFIFLLKLVGAHDLVEVVAAGTEPMSFLPLRDAVLGIGNASFLVANQSGTLTLMERGRKLIEEVDRDPNAASELLVRYVQDWYGLCEAEGHILSGAHEYPGGYYGYWSYSAAAVAAMFGIDDSVLVDHPNYPYDLAQYARLSYQRPQLRDQSRTRSWPEVVHRDPPRPVSDTSDEKLWGTSLVRTAKGSALFAEIAALHPHWATEALRLLSLKSLGQMSESDIAALVAKPSGALESEVAAVFGATSWDQNVDFARFMLIVYARYEDAAAVIEAVDEAEPAAKAVPEGAATVVGFRASEFGLALSTLLTANDDSAPQRRSTMTCDEEGDVSLVLDDTSFQFRFGEHLGAFVRAILGPSFAP